MKKMLHKLYDFWRLFSVSSENGDFRCGRNFGKSRAKCSGSSNFTDTSFAKTHYDSSLCAMFYLSCDDNRLLCLCFSGNHYKVYWEKRRTGKMEPYLLGVDFCALSVGLMIIGGLQAIQSVSIIAALPLIGVMFLLILSVIKMLKEREE